MVTTLILTVLITQSFGGAVSVIPNLTDHDCAEAKCVAKEGMTCAAVQARDDAQAAEWERRRKEYTATHSKEISACKARLKVTPGTVSTEPCGYMFLDSSASWGRAVSPGDIRTAVCAK